MANSYFRFKEFIVYQDKCAMKVTTDACLFGAWTALLLENDPSQQILDIGAGTGLLTLMAAQKKSGSFTAIEIDKNAALQASDNAVTSPWKDRIYVLHQNIMDHNGHYDTIISNPPFYENELISTSASRNTAHHHEGLYFAQLMMVVKRLLKVNGKFYLLLPYKRWNKIQNTIIQHGFFINRIAMVKPSESHQHFRVMVECSGFNASCLSEEICIKDKNDQYTKEFVTLLKDYYLYL